MKKLKVGYLIIAFLLGWLLVQFFLLPAICSAEPVYLITESELVTLEQNSNRQLATSSQLVKELQIAKEQLKVSDQELSEAKKQKEQLQKQLTEQEASSKKQENLQKEILKSLPPSAPGVLREIGLKIDVDDYVRGASFGVSRRIGSKYIGLRGEYEWRDNKAGMWVTYAY
jgi:FKBP-type peptidyl-prolyl cis-trans isomerase